MTTSSSPFSAVVHQIPAVTPEKQFPEIDEEIKNWKIGYAIKKRQQHQLNMGNSPPLFEGSHISHQQDSENTSLAFDRRKSAVNMLAAQLSRNSVAANNNNNNNTAASGGAMTTMMMVGMIDTIRLSRAPDQVEISQFMNLNLPTSMQDRQVTNFEVRRLMQRSRAKKGSSLLRMTVSQDDDDDGEVNKNDYDQHQHHHQQQQQHADQNQRRRFSQEQDEKERKKRQQEILFGANSEKDEKKKRYSIVTKLEVMDSHVLYRKGHELNQMIRDAARARAKIFPLYQQDQQDRASSSLNQQSQRVQQSHRHHHHHAPPSDIQVWYHRLGMDPPPQNKVIKK